MRLYLRAVSYFRQDLPLILLQLALIAASTGLGLLVAWPMAILVDSVFAAQAAKQDWIHRLFFAILPDSRLGQVIGLAGVGLALKLLGDGLGIAQTLVGNQVNYNGLMRVRCDLYRKLQSLNLAYHRAQPQGDAIYRLSSDTYGCQSILGVLVSTAVAVGTLVVMTCVLATRSWQLTLLALSVVPFLALANVVYGRRLKDRSLACKEQDSQFTTAVHRSMSCIGLVQAFGREGDEFRHFQNTVRGTIAAWWRLNWQQTAYNLIVGTLFGIGGAVVFGYGGYLVYQAQYVRHDTNGMTVGDLLVFTSYLGLLWGPLCSLTGFAANIQGGAAGAQRVFEILDRNPGITDAPGASPLPRAPRTIEFEHVTFGYDDARPVLRDVSLIIRPGEMVAFVGSSGVGKSTILNLLPRFYDPVAGAVRFDGVDLREIQVKDVRRHVALVLQESVILPTTVAENIAYGRPDATREQVIEAARLAGASEFIEALPAGYDTPIAEGGLNFSGGQRQRLSIARALLTEAPIVVLDEPTSALDPHHEHVVTESLRSIKGTRTVVLVSHRLGTVVECDRIFVMDGGRVVEHGTHADLIAADGLYASMARKQLGAPARRLSKWATATV
jgi:subfamily B ATP-binding cassette protein MsbA